jgi:hypothetical protein
MSQPSSPQNPRVARTLWPVLAVVAAMALVAPAARGKWGLEPQHVPVERLLKNGSRYLREHPKEAQGYCVVGRLQGV